METVRPDALVFSDLSDPHTSYDRLNPTNIHLCTRLLEMETARDNALVASGLSDQHASYQRLTPANTLCSRYCLACRLRVATRVTTRRSLQF